MRNLLRFVGLAQQPTAEIRGLITDASGAAVPGAAIEVVNPATGLHREAASNDSGNYVFSILPAGN
jgi:Carboxypeptidase regulatory-like domain